MLRRGCGYALANAGHGTRAIQDWLGHRSIQHTVRYTELAPNGSTISGANSDAIGHRTSLAMRVQRPRTRKDTGGQRADGLDGLFLAERQDV
jgi:integrase